MIPDEIWLRYIYELSGFIVDEPTLRSVWIDRKSGITSVVSFDELFEQLFDDLDSDHKIKELDRIFINDAEKGNAIREFLSAVIQVDEDIQRNPSLGNPESLLASNSWKRLRNVSQNTRSTLSAYDFGSDATS